MSKYIIRPISTGFAVYKGRTIFGRMKEVARHERLWDAEMQTLHMVTQDYHRELDYRRATNQVMSTDMMEPRRDEEHIYMALSLAGKKPPNVSETDEFAPMVKDDGDFHKYDNILETHLGKPITQVARVMFEERFMTWYGQHNPEWIDPRREREYVPAQDRMGRNRYSNRNIAGASAATPPPSITKWIGDLKRRATLLHRAIFGPTPITEEDIKRAAAAMEASTPGRGLR